MKIPVLVTCAILVIFSCGCMALSDEAVGIWENKTLPLQETMTIKSDGTYIISDMDGNEKSEGEWRNLEGHYEFIHKEEGKVIYAGIIRGGRGQVFLIFENITYLKI
ncbi:MAG: hypothetical protein JW931_05560 [Methanomicrobiaceae archaeon]|nr:hypothetical protein [Methanomicrobiaceae archaeon]